MSADIYSIDGFAAAWARPRARAALRPCLLKPTQVQAEATLGERAFMRALAVAGLARTRVMTMGLRSIKVLAHLIDGCGIAHLTACDEDAQTARRGERALHRSLHGASSRHAWLAGSKPLLEGAAARAAAGACDVIVAELPLSGCADLGRLRYRRLGLGMLDALLGQCVQHAPQARLILAAPGEVGRAVLEDLFANYGYTAQVLAAAWLPVDPVDELPGLVELERAARFWPSAERCGFADCALYVDARGEERINAADAAVLAQCDLYTNVRRPWFVFDLRPMPDAA